MHHNSDSPERRSLQAATFAMAVLLCPAIGLSESDLPPLDCVVTPSATADVSSAVPGVLETVHVDRSDIVEAGQVVAQLDSGVERASVALARTKAELETTINLARVNVKFDERRRQRVTSLHHKKVASYHDKDEAEREAARSAWKLQEANDLHRLRQLELTRAEEVLKQKTVQTPIDGVVVQRLKSAGEYVEDQPILRIAQLDPLHVEAIVPMELFGQIRAGMPADVVPEIVAEKAHRATVTVVDRMGDAASGTFGVRLTLPNPDHELPAGLKCSVTFLSAPRSAHLPMKLEQADASTAICGQGRRRGTCP